LDEVAQRNSIEFYHRVIEEQALINQFFPINFRKKAVKANLGFCAE